MSFLMRNDYLCDGGSYQFEMRKAIFKRRMKPAAALSLLVLSASLCTVIFGFLRNYNFPVRFYFEALAARAGSGDQDFYDWSNGYEIYPGVKYVRIFSRDPGPLFAHALRVDTSFENLKFCSTGRCPGWGAQGEWRDSAGVKRVYLKQARAQRTRVFLEEQARSGRKMIAAINSGAGWHPFDSGKLPFSSPSPECVRPAALIISDGVLVSEGEGPALIVRECGSVFLEELDSMEDISGISNAFGGFSWVLLDGRLPEAASRGNVKSPRTGIGISGDGRFVYLVVIDGRRRLISGGTVGDLGVMLKRFGALSGINIDGGGSSTMVKWDFNREKARLLNTPSDGWFMLSRERAVSNNLGIYSE